MGALLVIGFAFAVLYLIAIFIIAWAGAACAEDDDHAYKDAIGDYPTLPKERKP